MANHHALRDSSGTTCMHDNSNFGCHRHVSHICNAVIWNVGNIECFSWSVELMNLGSGRLVKQDDSNGHLGQDRRQPVHPCLFVQWNICRAN